MTSILIDYLPKDETEYVIVFQNTGKEDEKTLEFIRDFAIHFKCEIVWLEYCPVNRFKIVDFETASRNGEPFKQIIQKRKFLPNVVARFCTGELKVKPCKAFMKSLGYKNYLAAIGIRADEPRRVLKAFDANKGGKEPFKYILPLHQYGITKPMVRRFWDNQPFDLQLGDEEGNCDLCFLKGKRKLIKLITGKPEKANWWIDQEEATAGTFIKEIKYSQLLDMAQQSIEFEFAEPEIECYCNID